LFTGGCAPEQPLAPEESLSEIVGGQETEGHPAVAALYGKLRNEDGGYLCTATVIAPRVLLTAAHCLDPAITGGELDYKVIFEPRLTAESIANGKVVASFDWDRQFSKDNLPGGHDIAVVILAEPVSVTPIKFNRDPITAEHKNQNTTIVGYGLDDGQNQTGAGIKREGVTPLRELDELLLYIGGPLMPRTCQGDSGGPAFLTMNGEPPTIPGEEVISQSRLRHVLLRAQQLVKTSRHLEAGLCQHDRIVEQICPRHAAVLAMGRLEHA
jgi:hypothetical protein